MEISEFFHVARNNRPVAIMNFDIMRAIILFAALFVGGHAPVSAGSGQPRFEESLQKSTGRAILAYDRYVREGHEKMDMMGISAIIQKEYTRIKRFPVAYRIQFFWAIMTHVNLDAGYAHEFIDMIAHDCRTEYIAFLERFADTPRLSDHDKKLVAHYINALRVWKPREI